MAPARRRDALATGLARSLGRVSRVWGQRGLGTMFLWLGRAPVLRAARCTVEFEPGALFETAVFEPYWAPTVVAGRPYEPEVRHVLARLRDLDPVFVDCGANHGYWSILASGPALRYGRVLALEASPRTFRALARNAALNGERFALRHAAVAARSGERVRLVAEAHHAVTRIPVAGEIADGPEVTTITIDDALAERGWTRGPYLLKLDVEGHEIPAVDGAREVCAQDHAIVFEDWARGGYRTMRALMERGYRVHYATATGRCVRVATPEAAELQAVAERRVHRAQNLIATPGHGAMSACIEAWSKA